MASLKDAAAAIERRGAAKLVRASVLLPLPIFEGQYAGRFGILPPERLQVFDEVMQDSAGRDEGSAQALRTAADFIADSCRQLHARLEPGGPFEPLTHDSDGRPVRFDAEFAETVGLDPPDGAAKFEGMEEVVLACWTTDEGEVSSVALHGFGIRLLGFMQDTTRDVEDELVGESRGGRS